MPGGSGPSALRALDALVAHRHASQIARWDAGVLEDAEAGTQGQRTGVEVTDGPTQSGHPGRQSVRRVGSGKDVIAMMTVGDVMTRSVILVRSWTPLKEVAQLLIARRISGVPVVSDDGALLGVVSEGDFLMKEQGAQAVRHRPLARLFGESRESRSRLAKIGAVTAGEAMTAPAVTIASGRHIAEAAAVMTARGFNRLPVVDDGRLVGIVTRADLVRAYVRSDDELAATIRDDVLLRILWLDPAQFTVVVRDGVASVSGRVERRSTADMIERAVGMVPGIVDVHPDLTWALDDSREEPASLDLVFPMSPR
jgi:CBS domain-containing protein